MDDEYTLIMRVISNKSIFKLFIAKIRKYNLNTYEGVVIFIDHSFYIHR